MNNFVRVRSVNPTVGYRVDIEFTDGTKKEIDLEPYLHGQFLIQFGMIQNFFVLYMLTNE